MKNSLAKQAVGSHRVEASHQLTPDLRDGDESEAITVFDRAVTESMRGRECKAEEVGSRLGVSYQHLSDFRTGKRTIAFHRIMRLGNTCEYAARFILAALSEAWGFEPPRKRKRLAKADVKRQLEMELKKQPEIVGLFMDRIAKAFGTDVEEVQDAWSETTGVHDLVTR